MKTFLPFVAICLLACSCHSEPLPAPSTNVTVSWNYPFPDATGFQADYLIGPTNNWQTSTNWQPLLRAPYVPGQITYFATNVAIPPACLVAMWATNGVSTSAPSPPVLYAADPIRSHALPGLTVQ